MIKERGGLSNNQRRNIDPTMKQNQPFFSNPYNFPPYNQIDFQHGFNGTMVTTGGGTIGGKFSRPVNMPITMYDDLITSNAGDTEHESLLTQDMLRWKYASLERQMQDQNTVIERLQKTFWRHHLISDVSGYDVTSFFLYLFLSHTRTYTHYL